uniref:Uncharacterized protein n=1 Tax=Arundo donax TaxID=35708 RepID=A0A0A8ZKX6_ARUDO
MASSLSDTYM